MSDSAQLILLVVFGLATSVWIGGMVAIVIVARVTTATLDPAQRVAFFRHLGPAYLRLGGGALVLALASGVALLTNHDWDGTVSAIVIFAALLVLTLALGVIQARRMTHLRRAALAAPDDTALTQQVRRGARTALALRGTLGLLSLVLLVLAAALAV